MDSDSREDRIRELAYHLWLADGCPQGRALDYWLAAETAEAEASEIDEASEESFPASDPPARTVIVGPA